jgi:threonine/homoserine/homoserine lactone efflux protein
MDLAAGLILGIVYVAVPGPIGVEIVRQGIRGGLVPSLAVQTGSVVHP